MSDVSKQGEPNQRRPIENSMNKYYGKYNPCQWTAKAVEMTAYTFPENMKHFVQDAMRG